MSGQQEIAKVVLPWMIPPVLFVAASYSESRANARLANFKPTVTRHTLSGMARDKLLYYLTAQAKITAVS